MAELHVQRKRRSSWLLWLIIILVLAAVAYFLYTNYYQDNNSLTGLYKTSALAFFELKRG